MKQSLYGIGWEIHKTLRTATEIYPLKPYMGATCWPEIPDGVYKSWRRYGKETFWRTKLYPKYDYATDNQLAQREKYKESVQAWRDLTSPDKMIYHKLAIGKPMSGYNIFIKKYWQTHFA